MNPDPNTQPTPQPQEPVQPPVPPVAPSAPAPVEAAPAPLGAAPVPPSAPNPFGAAPVSSGAPVPGPVGQPGTIGSSPNSNPAPSFLNGPKKKLITMIAIIVGALVVLGIIAAVVLSMFVVSKKDYKEAATQFNVVSASYSKLNSGASSLQYDTGSSTTDTEFTNDTTKVSDSLKEFQADNSKLAGFKAVKVGDGKKLYDTYQGKIKSFVTYAEDMVTSLTSVRPGLKTCSDDSLSGTSALSACVDALGKVGDIPNADIKQYITALKEQYTAYLDVATKIAAIKDPYGKQYDQNKALRDQGYAIQDKISSASSDFTSNMSKHSDENDPSVAANALGTWLVKKANE